MRPNVFALVARVLLGSLLLIGCGRTELLVELDEPFADTDLRGDAGRDAGGDAGRDVGRPDVISPDGGKPDTGVPDIGRPDSGRPDTGIPDTGRPDSGRRCGELVSRNSLIRFEPGPAGTPVFRLQLEATADGPVTVTEVLANDFIDVTGPRGEDPFPARVPAGERLRLNVTLDVGATTSRTGSLVFSWTNDCEPQPRSLVIEWVNDGGDPTDRCLDLDRGDYLDLGEVMLGQRYEFDVTVSNCGSPNSEPLMLAEPEVLDDAAFGAYWPGGPPFLGPGEVATFRIVLDAIEARDFATRIVLRERLGSEPLREMKVVASARATDPVCPFAFAQCSADGVNWSTFVTAAPGTRILCNAEGTTTLDGRPIERYLWSWNRDDGTSQPLPPGFSTALVPESPGSSVVSMTPVVDGIDGCPPAFVELDIRPAVNPDSAFEFEVSWTADRDPGRADLDLHFVQTGRGGFYGTSWDCWYENPSPNWGAPEREDDNPVLGGDQTSAPGTESIRIGEVEPRRSYAVGVDNTSQGRSPLRATFVARQGGREVARLDSIDLRPGQFWIPGYVREGRFVVANSIYSGVCASPEPPSDPRYCR